MQYELTEDQKLIRDTAREFAEKHVREGVLERDEKYFPSSSCGSIG